MNKSKNLKKLVAFTLAETLVVIGIIGVISALTLPNLNSSTGDKEKVAQVKKAYQNLSDAIGRAEANYGPMRMWFENDGDDVSKRSKRVGERVSSFMKVSKNCGLTANLGCFEKGVTPKQIGGTVGGFGDTLSTEYKIIAADGMSFGFYTSGDKSTFVVDIDGPNKGTSTYGKDIFFFTKTENGTDIDNSLVPFGYDDNTTFASLVSSLKTSGQQAAAWVIKYDNMDYLQFTDTNGKCKNGTTVTETSPTCE